MITEHISQRPDRETAPVLDVSIDPRTVWERRAVVVVLLGVLVVAAISRLVGIAYDYPFLLESDEMTVYRSAVRMLAAHSIDPHFYYYGPLLIYFEVLWLLPYLAVHAILGHPVALSVTSYNSWTGTTSDPVMHVYGRVPFVIMGVAAVWLAFLVGRKLGGAWAGLLASAFLALSPLHANQSHFLLPNALTSFFALLTVWATLKHFERDGSSKAWEAGRARITGQWHEKTHWMRGESRYLLLATAAASLGAAIKYNAVVLMGIPVLTVFMDTSSSMRARFNRSIRLCVVATVVFFVVTPPAIFTPVNLFVHGLGFQIKHYARIANPDKIPSILWNGLYLIQHEGLLLFPVAVVGLLILAWREHRPIDVLLVATIGGYYVLLGVQKAHYDRNLLVILPLLSVSGAYVLARLAELRKPFGLMASAGLSIAILLALGRGTIENTQAFLSTPAQVVVHTWLNGHLRPHARLLADGYTVPPLDRSDVSVLYSTDTHLSPGAMRRRGVTDVVLAKSLPYYLSLPGRLASPHAILKPEYAYEGIVVYRVLSR